MAPRIVLLAILAYSWLLLCPDALWAQTEDSKTDVEIAGQYDNQAEHRAGQYRIHKAGTKVTATFSTESSPVHFMDLEEPTALFTLPAAYRPATDVSWLAEGYPASADGTSQASPAEPYRFRMHVDQAGVARYVDEPSLDGPDYLRYTTAISWSTTGFLDREVLEALYENTNGLNWVDQENWLSDRPLEEWHGVATDQYGHVTHLSLPINRLRGPFPSNLEQLSQLRYLNLRGNQISGTLPATVGQLSLLRFLYLGYNRLDGSVPASLGLLTSLEYLDLKENQFQGVIPTELGQLARLRYLDLAYNSLQGAIPAELGQLSELRHFSLWSNQLEGPVPPELGQLSKLELLNLGLNQLRGTIPVELSNLGLLKYLSLGYSSLSGNIPKELGLLFRLQELYLSNALFSGPIPREVGQLSQLSWLEFNNNNLTSAIPAELVKLKNLVFLDFKFNQLSGCVPREWYEDPNRFQVPPLPPCEIVASTAESNSGALDSRDRIVLETLYRTTDGPNWIRQDKWLSNEPLSSWYGVLTDGSGRVIALFLFENQLNGYISPELGELAMLQFLSLYGNSLKGSVPSELGKLSNLEFLDLSRNQINGEIPPELGQLVKLEHLGLGQNQVRGPVPPELARLTNLAALSLSQNQMEVFHLNWGSW